MNFVKLDLMDCENNVKGEAFIIVGQLSNLGNLRLVTEDKTTLANLILIPVSVPEKTKEKVKTKSEFPCPMIDCKSVLSNKANLKRHMADTHGPKIICVECGVGYTKASSFSNLNLLMTESFHDYLQSNVSRHKCKRGE